MHWDVRKLFQVLPFYNTAIEKPSVKKLSGVQLLKELPFYDELSIVKKTVHLVDMQEVIKLKLLTKKTLWFR